MTLAKISSGSERNKRSGSQSGSSAREALLATSIEIDQMRDDQTFGASRALVDQFTTHGFSLYNRAEYSRGRRIATSKSDSRTTASCCDSSPSSPSPSLSDPGSEEEASEEDVGIRQPDGEGSPVERSIMSDSAAPDASITSVCVPIATHSTHGDGAGAAAVGAGALSGGGAVAK